MTQPVDPHLMQWQAHLDQLIAENRAGYEELARQGLRFPFEQIVLAQIDCLIESIAEAMGPQQGPQFAVLARTRWEQRTAQNIEQAKKEGRKVQIAQGGSLSPADIRNLAKATGTFGA